MNLPKYFTTKVNGKSLTVMEYSLSAILKTDSRLLFINYNKKRILTLLNDIFENTIISLTSAFLSLKTIVFINILVPTW